MTKTCVVTGASSGIGKEAALGIAAAGFRVVLVCRDQARGEAALAEVRKHGAAELVLCDLASVKSSREGAEKVKALAPVIDVLVNNAGVYLAERLKSVDGHELTFATNHLGPFLFTLGLLDAVRGGRIINVASDAHKQGKIDLADVQMEARRYDGIRQYCNTKLMNMLFTRSLVARGMTAVSMHPGAVATNWARNEKNWFGRLVKLGSRFLRTPKQGADTIVWLAGEPGIVNGAYYVDRKVVRPRRTAENEALAEGLWGLSEKLAG